MYKYMHGKQSDALFIPIETPISQLVDAASAKLKLTVCLSLQLLLFRQKKCVFKHIEMLSMLELGGC